ncbi:hypothetical protein VNO80_26996 [Phaseolus coccineus]|uniref:Leucine-rich repeat-containing N-terminal plant-type domain-containing protein n=1 Tax=Phaseolus coccineus TaxID=3886 RepID=A0AAN9LG07_PHACN
MFNLVFHMELYRKKWWLVLLLGAIVVFGDVLGTNGCFQEEKRALLDFKASYGNESYVLLPSWLNDPKSNCCAWERVTCNSSSGHIIHLALGNLHRIDETEMGSFCFNPTRSLNWSFFLPLRELRSLGLSNYCFSGIIWNAGTI